MATMMDAELELLKSFPFTTLDEAEKKAAILNLLQRNSGLAQAQSEGISLLQSTLDLLGTGGEMEAKARWLAEELIKAGADPNVCDDDGDPLILHYALFAQLPQLAFLATHGADLKVVTVDEGRSPLHLVALLDEFEPDGTPQEARLVDQYLKAMALLLEYGVDVNVRDQRGMTPLHNASFLGNRQMVEFLLQRGAEVNAVNNDGETALTCVLGRLAETWAMDSEKQVVRPIVDLLRQHGGQDPIGVDMHGQEI